VPQSFAQAPDTAKGRRTFSDVWDWATAGHARQETVATAAYPHVKSVMGNHGSRRDGRQARNNSSRSSSSSNNNSNTAYGGQAGEYSVY